MKPDPPADEDRFPQTLVSPNTPPLPSPPALPDPFPGEYRVQRRLGEGGFGEVWLAEQVHLGRLVALKTIRPRGSGLPEDRLAALRHEAQLLAQLHHPNVAQVHDWRTAGNDHYLVMQYVSGGSLAECVGKEGPLPWADAARYVADVGEGLLAVHARGLVHRDIKPANVLWQPGPDDPLLPDRALLTDFGLAARLTDPGQVAGTPLFMAPEAMRGRIAPAMDVYSLAATLFWLLTGHEPFTPTQPHTDTLALLHDLAGQIERGLPDPDPRCESLPRALEQQIRAGLSADPQWRPTLQAFVSALRGALNQSLADSLTLPPSGVPSAAPVDLRLIVSREVAPNIYHPVAATQAPPDRLKRNMKKVPRPPQQMQLRSGDRVRIEVTADRAGYVTVFNVGPTGDLTLLYPDEPPSSATPLQPDVPLHILDVELQPPAGRERLFAVWTRRPLSLAADHLKAVAAQGAASQQQATRNMVKVKKSVEQLDPDDAWVAVLEVEHGA
jgi:serine/threonine protein kinase